MSRAEQQAIAEDTLRIQRRGFYTTPSDERVSISALQRTSEGTSRLITPEQGKLLVEKFTSLNGEKQAICEVTPKSTVQVLLDESNSAVRLAALNFASARNPGGGFLTGAMAQEEALASSSGLYNTLIRREGYYNANQNCRSMTYTDHAIYSPDVVFFRDASFRLLEKPFTASILTLPAVNMRQVREKRENVSEAAVVMKNRMRLCLAILAHEQNDTIVLGAYGCGVFGNSPSDVARWWRELLFAEGYGTHFSRVIFAILERQGANKTIAPFLQEFGVQTAR
ncbi:TIGR02452 family protein [Clostridia bacterium]|nr:TIGR02452 family protein [Clostridia bacterium]